MTGERAIAGYEEIHNDACGGRLLVHIDYCRGFLMMGQAHAMKCLPVVLVCRLF
jgi:hypothetical protein